MSRRAFFGIGSNLGDRWANLDAGVTGILECGALIGVSPIYETAPVGGPGGQGPYLNCVVGVLTDASPAELLRVAHRCENARGRVRAERFGPRTLDVDVLLVEGVTSDDPDLTIPHPRMWERAFVLVPLEDLAPGTAPTGWEDRLGGPEGIARSVRRVGTMLGSARAPAAVTAARPDAR